MLHSRCVPVLAGGAARSLQGWSWLLEQPLQVQAPGHGALPGSRGRWGWAGSPAALALYSPPLALSQNLSFPTLKLDTGRGGEWSFGLMLK